MTEFRIPIYLDDDDVAVLEREVVRTNKAFEDWGDEPNWTIEKELRSACQDYIDRLRRREKQELAQKNSTRTDQSEGAI